MKRIAILATAAVLATGVNAQLRVVQSGQVQVGTYTPPTSPYSASSPSNLPTVPFVPVISADTLATMRVIGKSSWQTGGRIAFGGRNDVSIAQSVYSSSGNPNTSLIFTARGGISYSNGTADVFTYSPTTKMAGTSYAPFSFSTAVSAPQYLTTSDSRLKSDIEALDSLGNRLALISPVSYVLTGSMLAADDNAPASKASALTQHRQFGFLAQDVKEVYPDLVYEDQNGMYSIDYTGFIAILVDAVQRLQTRVEQQAEVIESLQDPRRARSVADGTAGAVLMQNKPNPFRTSTVIDCVVPATVGSAFICVYDLNGQQKLRRDITARGQVSVTVDGNTMPAGMYIYALICDGMEIDSKRMILTD